MSNIANKIEAKDYPIREVLDNNKYTIDYFQREYKWRREHIEQLIADLEAAFFNNYKPEHKRQEVANYNNYYLGSMVLSEKDGKKSVIDGQQRLTSITILLLYLNNLQKDRDKKVNIDSLIYSEKYDEKSFNLDVPERQHCLEALYQHGEYTLRPQDDESIRNMVHRYNDVATFFPDDLKEAALPYFIDWLRHKVVLVVITAYSEDNAYTIFETMNDRGLKLTPSEMLKGYILSKVGDQKKRTEMDTIWRDQVKKLHYFESEEDLRFFQAWLRGKYAITIRPSSQGAANEDFEKIGTRFHTWVKESITRMNLSGENDFYAFVKTNLVFYSDLYIKIYRAQANFTKGLEHLYYQYHIGVAPSLADPLLMAPIHVDDPEEVVNQKLDLVARFMETFAVYRIVNYRNYGQSTIRYTLYSLILSIRNKSVQELAVILKEKLEKETEKLAGVDSFHMHGQNKWLTRYLLSRITSHIEQKAGMSTDFTTYYHPKGKSYDIEHIWANHPEDHIEELTESDDFYRERNKIGGLLLLPRGTNQSFSDDSYEDKLPHYLKQNLLVQSLHEACYQKNPNFLHYMRQSGLPFKPHAQFKLKDMQERQGLYRQVCEEIWSLDHFNVN